MEKEIKDSYDFTFKKIKEITKSLKADLSPGINPRGDHGRFEFIKIHADMLQSVGYVQGELLALTITINKTPEQTNKMNEILDKISSGEIDDPEIYNQIIWLTTRCYPDDSAFYEDREG